MTRTSTELREIHVEIDEAVMAAYGWDDVHLDHGFHSFRKMQRWTVEPGRPRRDPSTASC